MSKYIPLLVLVLIVAASAALVVPNISIPTTPVQTTATAPGSSSTQAISTTSPQTSSTAEPTSVPTSTEVVRKFRSYEDLVNFIKESQEVSYYRALPESVSLPVAAPVTATVPAALPVYAGKEGIPTEVTAVTTSTVPYSKTNIQVAGVDEADIVKTDGEFIYFARGREVLIVRAYPPGKGKVADVLKFNKTERVAGLYVLVNGTARKLVVITTTNYWYIIPLREVIVQTEATEPKTEVGVQPAVTQVVTVTRTVTVTIPPVPTPPIPPKPPRIAVPNTTIYIYDVGGDGKATYNYNLTVSGRYVTSRMINGRVYVLTSMPAVLIGEHELVLPAVNGVPVDPESIYYFEVAPNYVFTMISAIDALSLKHKEHVFLTGGSSWVYVSRSNIYVLSRKFLRHYDLMWEVIKVIEPELPEDLSTIISVIMNSSVLPHSAKISTVGEVIQTWLNTMNITEREKWMKRFTEVANEVLKGKALEETVIYRFAIKGLDVVAEAKGSVPGYVLDQFSMDEYKGYFRVATTSSTFCVEDSVIRTKRVNNVYVLDMNLSIVGKLEGLAPGERIYAARYLGDLMYLVTYRQVDPLYGIDLSDPENPKVIGYLKIPGYSEYLHPFRDRYLIGIGIETDKSGRFVGLKVSLFDISNPKNITEVSKIVIKGAFKTPVFSDHKAFLINYLKNYTAFPVYGVREGVAVIGVNDGNLTYRGFLEHANALRALYIGDYIYSISQKSIKVFDDSALEEVAEIELTPLNVK